MCCPTVYSSIKHRYSDQFDTLVSKCLGDLQLTAICLICLVLHCEPELAIILEMKNQHEEKKSKLHNLTRVRAQPL